MLKLSKLRVISEIEFIINKPGPSRGQHKWMSAGVECSIDRHSFTGELYSFHVEILQLRAPAVGRPNWKLMIVSEFWHAGDGESIHSTKWLKLLLGKPADIVKWIGDSRRATVTAADEDRKP